MLWSISPEYNNISVISQEVMCKEKNMGELFGSFFYQIGKSSFIVVLHFFRISTHSAKKIYTTCLICLILIINFG